MPEKNKKTIDRLASKTKIYMGIIAVLLIIICIYEQKLILPSILLYIGILHYSIWVAKKRNSEISNHIQELVFDVDNTAKRTLINSPFPLVILETNNNIIWKSSKFVSEFMNIDINTYLDDIIKEVKKEISSNNNGTIDKQITIGNKSYQILGEYVKSKKKEKNQTHIMTLYFIDITEQERLLKEYNDSKTCIGIIMVDNYDEIAQRIPKENMSQIIAKIEKNIYEWVEQMRRTCSENRKRHIHIYT